MPKSVRLDRIQPTWKNGAYARYKGEAAHPELLDGMVAGYSMGLGDTGDKLYDVSGRGNTGTWFGSGDHWDDSDGRTAGQFNGTDDYVYASSFFEITSYPFWLNCWVKLDDGASSQTFMSLLDVSVNGTYYVLETRGGVASIIARNPTFANEAGTTSLGTTRWRMITGVFANDTSKRLYVDGIQEAELTTSVPYSSDIDGLLIGQLRLVGPTDYTNGRMDDCSAYSGDPGDSLIRKLYQLGRGGWLAKKRRTIFRAPTVISAIYTGPVNFNIFKTNIIRSIDSDITETNIIA